MSTVVAEETVVVTDETVVVDLLPPPSCPADVPGCRGEDPALGQIAVKPFPVRKSSMSVFGSACVPRHAVTKSAAMDCTPSIHASEQGLLEMKSDAVHPGIGVL